MSDPNLAVKKSLDQIYQMILNTIVYNIVNNQDCKIFAREEQEKCYGLEISAATQPGIQTYEGYKAQHEQFVSHAENQFRQITADIDSLQVYHCLYGFTGLVKSP